MEREEAIKTIEQVCSIYKGTLQEHQVIQEALRTLKGGEEHDTTNE